MLMLQEWSPFPDAEYRVIMRNAHAMVWSWSHKQITEAQAPQPSSAKNAVIIPEPLLQPPLQEGLRLIQQLDGIEGQRWHNGVLTHARWWSETTLDDAEWLTFQRSAGIAHEDQTDLPVVTSLPRQEAPWAMGTNPHKQRESSHQQELAFYGSLIMVLAISSAWHGLKYWQLGKGLREKQAELQRIDQQARPILAARELARKDADTIQSIADLQKMPSQLTLMAEIAKILPDNGAYVRDWDYREGKIKFSVYAPNKGIARAELAAAIEKVPYLQQVQALMAPDPKVAVFTADVRTVSELPTEPQNE